MSGQPRPDRVPDSAPGSSPYKSRGGGARLIGALRYSRQGLVAAFQREAAFRQELALAAVLLPVALLLPFSAVERVLLIGSVMLVLVIELLNSALEAIADRISTEHHPLAGQAKDLGSAAVMLALLLCAFAWLSIAGPVLIGLALQLD